MSCRLLIIINVPPATDVATGYQSTNAGTSNFIQLR
jgi:hypothetical protein